jgi:DNA-directed RNA polymerase subunit RPC12/RpoP
MYGQIYPNIRKSGKKKWRKAMKEKIKVKCAFCGAEIGELHNSPEKKYFGCGECGKRTLVTINKDGSVNTKIYEEKHIPHKNTENAVKSSLKK